MMNQFNNQQGQMGGYGMYPNQPGTQYGQFQSAKMTQPLTPEQMRELRSTGSGFTLKVDPIEITRSHCTHKDNGNITLVKNNDGSSTCTICGATFNLIDKEVEEIAQITQAVIDVLQSIKTYYLDIPENYVKDYFNMIPYLEKLPKFFEVAIHNFAKYENGAFLNNSNNMYGFQMLNALASPGYGQINGGMMGGQPQGGYGMQQPMMQQQPYAQPQFPQQAPQGYNPFGGVQQPMMQQQVPQGYGYGMQEQQMQQPNPQQQPVVENNTTVEQPQGQQAPQVVSTKTFNV